MFYYKSYNSADVISEFYRAMGIDPNGPIVFDSFSQPVVDHTPPVVCEFTYNGMECQVLDTANRNINI